MKAVSQNVEEVKRTVWERDSPNDAHCKNCGLTWDMHLCDEYSSCPRTRKRKFLRVVVQVVDTGAAAHVGGPVDTTIKTFDIQAPELEAFLRELPHDHQTRRVIGVELLP